MIDIDALTERIARVLCVGSCEEGSRHGGTGMTTLTIHTRGGRTYTGEPTLPMGDDPRGAITHDLKHGGIWLTTSDGTTLIRTDHITAITMHKEGQ